MTGEISRMIQVAAGDSANVAEDTKHVAEGVGDTLQPAAEARPAPPGARRARRRRRGTTAVTR